MNIWNKTFQKLIFTGDIQAAILAMCLLTRREPFYTICNMPYNFDLSCFEFEWRWKSDEWGYLSMGEKFDNESEDYTASSTPEESIDHFEEFYKQYKQGLL